MPHNEHANNTGAQAPATPLRDRIKGIQKEVKKLGRPNPNFDEKAFLDEMWELDDCASSAT